MEPKDIFPEGNTEILYFLMHITVHWTSLLFKSEMPLVHDKQFQRQWDSQDWIGWKPNFWSLPKFSFSKWLFYLEALCYAVEWLFKLVKKHFICIINFYFCFIKGYCSLISIPIPCIYVLFILCLLFFLFYIYPGSRNHDDCKWLDIFQSPSFLWPKKH